MKKRVGFALFFIGIVFGIVGMGYFMLAHYYDEGFGPNVWINGIYVTGMSVDEVNEELRKSSTQNSIRLLFGADAEYELDLDQVDYTEEYCEALVAFQNNQKSFWWLGLFFGPRKEHVEPKISFDSQKLNVAWKKVPFVAAQEKRETTLYIYESEQGYRLYDGLSHRFDSEKAFQALENAIAKGDEEIIFDETSFFFDRPDTPDEEAQRALWEQIDAFQQCNLVYDMGEEKIPFTEKIMSGFIRKSEETFVLDDDGRIMLDAEAVENFIWALSDEYDTYGKSRSFQSTRGDVVEVLQGTYGTLLDREEEIDFLMDNLLSDNLHTSTKVIHIPNYKKMGAVRGKNDIGGTYIEIDMTEQKLYFYQDGELTLETDVVTGNTGRRMGTPQGSFYVYAKQRNRILRGADYNSFVKYWMPVKGAVGIHDAGWRNKFGGEIYKTSGSHGCINTPTEKMSELYEMVEINTPVLIFY